MYVNATDLDDQPHSMANLFIRFSCSFPRSTMSWHFQINNQTGGISLTPQGELSDALMGLSESIQKRPRSISSSDISFPLLSYFPQGPELDPLKNPQYKLVVSVAGLGGLTEHSFSDSVPVDITVKENIWKPPEPVAGD